jgi:BASS family bile acid:Na+ symporter
LRFNVMADFAGSQCRHFRRSRKRLQTIPGAAGKPMPASTRRRKLMIMRSPNVFAPLAWLGRQRGRAVAVLVIAGTMAPGLGALLKPYVGVAVFVLLTTAFLRADIDAAKRNLSRPALVLICTFWTMVAIPALTVAATALAGLRLAAPDLHAALMLQAMTSPMMSAPAFAALMGLDATLPLATLVLSSVLLPVTATLFTAAAGLNLPLSPLTLGAQLGGLLGGSALIAFLIRSLVSYRTIQRRADELDGFNILILFVFAAALMSDVVRQAFAEPLTLAALTALGFATSFGLVLFTALVFRRAGREQAFAIGVLTSQRNLGLMLAATGGAVPPLVWLYIAVSQFPIYFGPLMLTPLARRVQSHSDEPQPGGA